MTNGVLISRHFSFVMAPSRDVCVVRKTAMCRDALLQAFVPFDAKMIPCTCCCQTT